ncbi:hypothetical protein [Nocardia abscessus]|uniref:hypothetical protein n=1 Tax=Nocardia abscessus TaxID=120957 RepID=UPI0024584D76|nr:hypothetical protein [Nocardia abscessus]
MKIDVKAFVAAVRKRAADNPDKVYQPVEMDEGGESCVYVERDHETGELVGSCLIGCALVDIGVPAERLDYVQMSFSTLNSVAEFGIPVTVADWAQGAQIEQDRGTTWGESVKIADELYPLEGII